LSPPRLFFYLFKGRYGPVSLSFPGSSLSSPFLRWEIWPASFVSLPVFPGFTVSFRMTFLYSRFSSSALAARLFFEIGTHPPLAFPSQASKGTFSFFPELSFPHLTAPSNCLIYGQCGFDPRFQVTLRALLPALLPTAHHPYVSEFLSSPSCLRSTAPIHPSFLFSFCITPPMSPPLSPAGFFFTPLVFFPSPFKRRVGLWMRCRLSCFLPPLQPQIL